MQHIFLYIIIHYNLYNDNSHKGEPLQHNALHTGACRESKFYYCGRWTMVIFCWTRQKESMKPHIYCSEGDSHFYTFSFKGVFERKKNVLCLSE